MSRRREIAPTHFPGADGSYQNFLEENLGNTACCTGTPPRQIDRNIVSPSGCLLGVAVVVVVVLEFVLLLLGLGG